MPALTPEFVAIGAIVLIVLNFVYQNKIFITPEVLERKHREILDDVENKFATKEDNNHLRDIIDDMKEKIDKMYEKMMSGK